MDNFQVYIQEIEKNIFNIINKMLIQNMGFYIHHINMNAFTYRKIFLWETDETV
jgi:hypothetical protein